MTRPGAAPTLPEDLLLLAMDPVRGKPYCGNRALEFGVAGAVLAELELQGRVDEQRGQVRVANPLDPPDPLLAAVLRSLPAPGKSRYASAVDGRGWIRRAGREVGGMYLEALVRRGVLGRETRRLLGLLPYHRHPAGPGYAATRVRERFGAAEAAGFTDVRGRRLAALVSAIGLSSAASGSGWQAGAAMRSLVRDDWAAHAVDRAVRQEKAKRNASGFGAGGLAGGGRSRGGWDAGSGSGGGD